MPRVALIGDNSIEYVNALIHIWNNGDCAVLIDWRIPFQTAYEMMLEANVSKCYIERKILQKIEIDDYVDIEFITYNNNTSIAKELPVNIYEQFHSNYCHNEAVVIYSSGTTGKSKGVILSHYAISTNADAIIKYMELDSDDCIYVAKSLSHSSTLTGELLVALKSRTRLIIAPTVVSPRIVFANMQKFKVSILCLNPTLLQLYATEYQRNRLFTSSLKTIYVSGSILNDSLYRYAHEVFDKVNIYNVYGLSEAGPRVTAQSSNCCKSNSVGKPIDGVKITVVDNSGIPVKPSERGIIHVNTKSKYMYYVCGKEKFQSLYNGWLNTGDIGYIDNAGELHVVDRIDDVINIGAHKIYPSDIEKLVLEDDRITACVVSKFTYNETEVIGCLYVSDNDRSLSIMQHLKTKLMLYEIPKRYVRVSEIPCNMRGKVNRNEVSRVLSQ